VYIAHLTHETGAAQSSRGGLRLLDLLLLFLAGDTDEVVHAVLFLVLPFTVTVEHAVKQKTALPGGSSASLDRRSLKKAKSPSYTSGWLFLTFLVLTMYMFVTSAKELACGQ
jgi:hypothetical protein